ncbi:DUF3499 domain-containing protein [Corynebacterium belfantii]|uniref:DUF3499 domain-containing protein n=1 Tax=Corynebacterium belfantii TaxID=2014537 RepID=A0ABS0LAX4_9CORY|nr:DUF3499 domain-containing protein [Corynebacterium belfantii]OLN16434.1 hypothetical protein BUE64_03100 [Corynebacterium diphtheriae subsp. lausannense]QVI97591.1 DUF3499 domain-containing protein [Corynebacterium diphtheriae]MBG9243664.1 DUF3499 domain-containing protein [Corynebacterium belfantii]MBG9258391.1 DUF3499 domain-containing protein [Corynebacterium belfantii]MBG9265064.1 DUF3499 domain-containing protein [Corynebacterium belfantii]
MNHIRRCSRPGCGKPAVATLTYAYARSTAVVGPLSPNDDPHSWDLCEAHAARTTAPLGWELVHEDLTFDDESDLTALAEAVREAGTHASGLVDPIRVDTPVPEDIGGNHPINRVKRQRGRRAHLSVVPEPEDDDDSD